MHTNTIIKTTIVAASIVGLAACGGPEDVAGQHDSIVGGARDNGHPAVAYIRMLDRFTGNISICTGTLIDPSVILTAGHCVNPDGRTFGRSFEVAFGTERNAGDATDGWQPVSTAVVHPNWNPNVDLRNGNDIAALVMRNAVDDIAPMNINRRALSQNDIGQSVVAVGWGTTVRSDINTAGIKRKVDIELNGFNDLLISTGRANASVCGGDSGGPHFMNFGSGEVVVGVTSFGPSECDQGAASQTRVDTFADWVDDVVARHGTGGAVPPQNNPPQNNPPQNNPPQSPIGGFGVEILEPSAGAQYDVGADVFFSGQAGDHSGNDVSDRIVWSSNIDGTLGQGAEFTTTLSEGNHSITARLTIDNSQASKTINVTVGNGGGGSTGFPPELCERFPWLCD